MWGGGDAEETRFGYVLRISEATSRALRVYYAVLSTFAHI